MLAYHLRIAAASLRRSPGLTALLVTGIAVGVAVATSFVTTHHVLSGNPLPHKDDRLFNVLIDNWQPEAPFDDENPAEPPPLLSWPDVQNLLASDIPVRQTASFRGNLTVLPEGPEARPFKATTRMTRADFFPMFEVPFLYGGPWSPSADEDAEAVVVLDEATNRRLFGGEDSTGRAVRIEGRDFRVAGVMAPWFPKPRLYDVTQGGYEEPEEIFLPLAWAPLLEVQVYGNISNWRSYDGDDYADFLASDSIFLQMWVELPDAASRDAYAAFLDAYVAEQKTLGRHPRPVNNRLYAPSEWLQVQRVVPESARTMLVIGLLFLLVSAINLVGILLGKFLARAPEVGVRRALGASRSSIFLQHIVECEVVGLVGGAVGLVVAVGMLRVMNRLFGSETGLFSLDASMVLAGVALALIAGAVAGAYPAWRICRVPPAAYLKQQ